MSPFAWNCPRVTDFMMCSMLACSRSSSAHRRPRHQFCQPGVIPEPLCVEQARLARGVRLVLVHWQGEPTESASWEDLDEFRSKYPDFQLEDELGLEGGEMSCGGARTGAAVTCTAPPNAQHAHRRRTPRGDRQE
jgi:hypothetical protein